MKLEHGYFPPGSMLRKVHRERAVGLIYGQRALAIGAIDPRNFVGTRTHTRHASRPFRRLAATDKMFEEIFFGTKSEADRVLAAVHRMHSTVKGELPEDAGSMPDGTPYSALDPELMLWTIAHSRTRGPAMRLHNVVMNGSLPARMRELYRLRWTPADTLAFRAVVAASRAARPLTARSALHGRCTSYFDDVAAAERARIESGRPARGALAPVG